MRPRAVDRPTISTPRLLIDNIELCRSGEQTVSLKGLGLLPFPCHVAQPFRRATVTSSKAYVSTALPTAVRPRKPSAAAPQVGSGSGSHPPVITSLAVFTTVP